MVRASISVRHVRINGLFPGALSTYLLIDFSENMTLCQLNLAIIKINHLKYVSMYNLYSITFVISCEGVYAMCASA